MLIFSFSPKVCGAEQKHRRRRDKNILFFSSRAQRYHKKERERKSMKGEKSK